MKENNQIEESYVNINFLLEKSIMLPPDQRILYQETVRIKILSTMAHVTPANKIWLKPAFIINSSSFYQLLQL